IPLVVRVPEHPLLYLITLALQFRHKTSVLLGDWRVRFFMYGQVKFRFLERTDSRRCRSLIRSCGERFLLSQRRQFLPDFVKGERSECISPLTTLGQNKLVRVEGFTQ
ncbi:hypothetical protein, partial [Salmonella sp. SKLX061842]